MTDKIIPIRKGRDKRLADYVVGEPIMLTPAISATERRLVRDAGMWLSGAATILWGPAAWHYFIGFLVEISAANDLVMSILQHL